MEPRIEPELPDAEYRAAPGLAQSALKEFARTPAHYQAYIAAPSEQTDAMRIGSATHAAIFEPYRFAVTVAAGPDVAKNTKEWKEWAAVQMPGALLLKKAEHTAIVNMANAVQSHPLVAAVLADGLPEVSVFADDREHGVLCKGRFDWLARNIILDVKTCEDAGSGAFGRSAANFRYHLQAAHYWELAWSAGIPLGAFWFVAVEKTPPYGVAVYQIESRDLDAAIFERGQLIRAFKECQAKNEWPGYSTEKLSLELPRWVWKNAPVI